MENESTYYIDLIVRYLAGEAKAEEMRLLSSWLNADPENRNLFSSYQKTWQAIEKHKIEKDVDLDVEWDSMKQKIRLTEDQVPVIPLEIAIAKKQFAYRQILQLAAIVLVLLGTSLIIYLNIRKIPNQMLVAQTVSVERSLPDGTDVTLNANSTLAYPTEFEGKTRAVRLKGEAFFNVSHNANKPFIISAGNTRIEVLGTSFYVNTNNKNGNIEVVLVSGKVMVYFYEDSSVKKVLSPGEKVEVAENQYEIIKTTNADPNFDAWKTRKIVFMDNSLAEVIEVLNKIYQANIILSDKQLANCRITATFDNQSLESVLTVLKETLDLQLTKEESSFRISGKGCK